MPAPDANALSRLREALPEDMFLSSPEELADYGLDATRVYTPAPCLVALPRSTHMVSELLSRCDALSIPVVPSGGRTGLAGGAVARDGELVLSLSRMKTLYPVDPVAMTLRVEAGAVTESVHMHCAPFALTWPVDFASKGSSQVGGNIATNAGGVKVIRYGLTRQWVLGLTVVTARGEVLGLNGALEKNNTGFDLRQLFIGTEGTLGVITEATLKLTRVPPRLDVMLFALPDVPAVLNLFREARTAPFILSAYEFFTDRCLARVERHRGLVSPFDSPSGCYVLIECESHDPEALEAWCAGLFEREIVRDGTLARSASQSRALWALRESISESLSGTGTPHKNDVALPIASLEGFCAELSGVFSARYPGWEIALFGHIGDGNLHINVMKPEGMTREDFFARTHEADEAVFSLVRAHGGSVSAEHGIGLLKREFLHYTRSESEILLLRQLKSVLDPKGILNPGKILG